MRFAQGKRKGVAADLKITGLWKDNGHVSWMRVGCGKRRGVAADLRSLVEGKTMGMSRG